MSDSFAWSLAIGGFLVLYALLQFWWTRQHARNLEEHNKRVAEIYREHNRRMDDIYRKHP